MLIKYIFKSKALNIYILSSLDVNKNNLLPTKIKKYGLVVS